MSAQIDGIIKDHIRVPKVKLIPFIGSGMSKPMPTNLPTWPELSKSFLAELSTRVKRPEVIPYCESLIRDGEFYKAFSEIYSNITDATYLDALTKLLPTQSSPNILHDSIVQFKPHAIFTTNFDICLEDSHVKAHGAQLRIVLGNNADNVRDLTYSHTVTKPSVQTIQKIAKSLGVPMKELLK